DAAQDALAKGYDSTDLRLNLYTLAFLQNNSADMQQQVAWARGKPGAEEMLLLNEADTAGYFGKLRRARELEAQAVAVAERAGEKETAASFEADAGFREGLFGNSAEARHYADRALALSAGRDVRFGAAMALALGGDYARARTVEDDMNKRYPTDTVVQFNFLPSLRAQLAIAKGDVPAALTALQAASPYELGIAGFSLCPVYLRGRADLLAHDGKAANAEFQEIIDHRGIVQNAAIGALAYLQQARAYSLVGEKVSSRNAYYKFLELWKYADPDIPILKRAKAEYAKLQ